MKKKLELISSLESIQNNFNDYADDLLEFYSGLSEQNKRYLLFLIQNTNYIRSLIPRNLSNKEFQFDYERLILNVGDDLKQFATPIGDVSDIESSEFIKVNQARRNYKVSGKGINIAVIDSGIKEDHVDFNEPEKRIISGKNFTDEGSTDNVTDNKGHGTHVSGIIAANKIHIGIAPQSRIIPLKVVKSNDFCSLEWILNALEWVINNKDNLSISIVNISIQDNSNDKDESFIDEMNSRGVIIYDEIRKRVKSLFNYNIPVVVSAGNRFFFNNSQEGMSFPAIISECISVGAVYDAVSDKKQTYSDGAEAFIRNPGQITPYTQRLSKTDKSKFYTTIFAPGSIINSTGIDSIVATSVQNGTSQAAPIITGVIALIQEYYYKIENKLPTVNDLKFWLQLSGITFLDSENENDNTINTKKEFKYVDCNSALSQVNKFILEKRLE